MLKRAIKKAMSPILSPFRPGNIVMIHLGRSGSTVLADLLEQHPKIYWGAEIYNRIFRHWVKEGKEEIESFPYHPIDFLRKDMLLALHRYYGFEIKPFHLKLINLTPESFLQHLDKLNYTHFIVLDRKNRMRKIISSILAHTNKDKYHIKNTKDSSKKAINIDVQNVCIDFECKPLIEFLTDYDKQMNTFRQLLDGKKILYLSYEEHIQDDPTNAYIQTCDFLNIKPRKVNVRLSRTNPFPVKDMIENFDEVSQHLKGSPFEWMLKE